MLITKEEEVEEDSRQEFQIVGFSGSSYGLLDPKTNKIIFAYEDIILERYLERILSFDFKVYVETND